VTKDSIIFRDLNKKEYKFIDISGKTIIFCKYIVSILLLNGKVLEVLYEKKQFTHFSLEKIYLRVTLVNLA